MRHFLARLYGAAARRRRRYFATHPDARRRLDRPVISVGALRVGGSGKTPVAAAVCERLVAMGERPALLSRGYGRAQTTDGVVVVRDHTTVLGRLDTAGDEPWMLAEQLDGVAVVVAPDRFLAGTLAERCLDATVHVLDDGFQHLGLDRTCDLVVVRAEELDDEVLPAGRLRERLEAAGAADALLVVDRDPSVRDHVAERLGASRRFGVTMAVHPPTLRSPTEVAAPIAPDAAVFILAGIADPARFVRDVTELGWSPAGTAVYPDHHRYTAVDVERVMTEARAVGAEVIVTTDKDWVRLARWCPGQLPLAVARLRASVEPADAFDQFLADGLRAARERAA